MTAAVIICFFSSFIFALSGALCMRRAWRFLVVATEERAESERLSRTADARLSEAKAILEAAAAMEERSRMYAAQTALRGLVGSGATKRVERLS